jgi:cell division protein FtsI (penicillin-binding protein 3)
MDLADQLKAQAGPGLIAGVLYRQLGGDFQDYFGKLTQAKNDDGTDLRYVVLSRSVRNYTDELVNQELAQLGCVGLAEEQAPVRLYPQGSLAANVLGYMVYDADLDAAGQYPWSGGGGLELALNTNLACVDGREVYEATAHGRIPTAATVLQQPQNGISYQLTLDAGLQYMAEQDLQAAVTKYQAQSGVAVAMNVKTGEILALANSPTFDPNALAQAQTDNLGNRALTQVYEPGSVEKVLTMAALVDAGLAAPDTRVVVPGSILSGGKTLSDDDAHGTLQLTATGVIAQSSNVGMALLTRQIDKGVLSNYLSNFGLGQLTGLDWPGEQSGSIPGADMSDQTRDQIAFGQGLSVTAVQEAAAVAGIVDGGVYHSPTLIRAATTSDGQPYQIPSQTTRQVISTQASATMVAMMEAGTATNKQGIPGYNVAGKTGTADRFNATCSCYRGVVGSFVGVAPAENPQILVYVALDDPQQGQYGAVVAQPTATDILKVALPRYGVPPSTTPPPALATTW